MAGKKGAPEIVENINRLLEFETAGDPVTGLRWTQKTTKKIAEELSKIGIRVCPNTVARILKELGFSLRTNQKNVSSSSVSEEVRDEQFKYISRVRKFFAAAGHPIISIDTKKKEMIGNFKNPGKAWTKSPVKVNDHDFRSQSYGMAVPYGIYDTQANRGSVFIGTSSDTTDFSSDCLAKWYENEGQYRYPHSKELLILADSGGSNGSRSRVWKHRLQEKLANKFGLTITVCHYPPGCSKWNPIEHRLFSEISKNWAAMPLVSYEVVLNYISTTTTSTGLKVEAYFLPKEYKKGVRVSSEDMEAINITKHTIQPRQNYTIKPQVTRHAIPNKLDFFEEEQQLVELVASGSNF